LPREFADQRGPRTAREMWPISPRRAGHDGRDWDNFSMPDSSCRDFDHTTSERQSDGALPRIRSRCAPTDREEAFPGWQASPMPQVVQSPSPRSSTNPRNPGHAHVRARYSRLDNTQYAPLREIEPQQFRDRRW
jgi:hypothetical protein